MACGSHRAQIGVVIALGASGYAHGLKRTLWPVAAAFIPGLPTTFAVIFYFLLETRQTQAGGVLLPLHANTPLALVNERER